MAKTKRIGILTAGGDSPGLNAAIRGVGKTALGFYGMEIIGFRDGFRGIVEDRRLKLDKTTLAGILTVGGTILGTSRDKPHRMLIDGRTRDMTAGHHRKLQEIRISMRWSAWAAAARKKARCTSPKPGSTSSPCPRPLTTTWP